MGTKKILTKKQRTKRRIILFAIEVLILLFCLLGVFVWQKLNQIERDEEIPEEELKINELTATTKEVLKGYTNIAIFGLDNRSNGSLDSGNSDVIMIASINNDTNEVKLVSVYRDTYLDTGDGTFRKANAAYNRGGPKMAVAMLNASLDLDIKNYVSVDFRAVSEAVDLLGGVEITIEPEEVELLNSYTRTTAEVTGKKANYISSAGTYVLDGTQATGYARIRYTAGDDYRRTERQRTVVEQMVKKAKQTDLATLNNIIDVVCRDIKTNMSNSTILSLAAEAMNYELVDTHGFPFESHAARVGTQDAVVPTDLEMNVKELHEYLFDVDDYETSNIVKAYSREIINTTGFTRASTSRDDNPLDEVGTKDGTETSVSPQE
jgi:LCP family protein required for cell wall assembly